MADFNFSDMTTAQQALLTLQGWAPGRGKQPRPNTVTKLVARGRVVVRPVRVAGVDIAAYEVPIAVHVAWCARCAGTEKAAGRLLDGVGHDGFPEVVQ